MNKTIRIIISILAILLISGLVFWSVKNRKQQKIEPTQNIVTENENEQKQEPKKETLEDLIDSVKEIKFPEIDTSKWQTYKNERYGFEMKIPKDWYAENASDGVFCLKSKTKIFYFEGEKGVCGISIDTNFFKKYFVSENEVVVSTRESQNRGAISRIGYIYIDGKKSLYYAGLSLGEIIFNVGANNFWFISIQGTENIVRSKSISISNVFSGIIQTFHLTN